MKTLIIVSLTLHVPSLILIILHIRSYYRGKIYDKRYKNGMGKEHWIEKKNFFTGKTYYKYSYKKIN